MQKARALIGATIVGLPLWCLLFFSLHATREIATVAAAGVGLAIFAVVATGTEWPRAVVSVAFAMGRLRPPSAARPGRVRDEPE